MFQYFSGTVFRVDALRKIHIDFIGLYETIIARNIIFLHHWVIELKNHLEIPQGLGLRKLVRPKPKIQLIFRSYFFSDFDITNNL